MHNNPNLLQIHRKVDEIKSGLLRFRQNDCQASLHVKVKISGINSLHCVMTNQADLNPMVPGIVSLIQKSDKDYLYISGEIENQLPQNKKTFSVRIVKACWFILKSKGAVSWLQEKYIYDSTQVTELGLAS